jgi:hypothetical protein
VEDGIFYMCFEDFLTNFATVSTCFIRSPRERQWHEKRFSGVFRSTAGDPLGITASGALPQEMYHLTVTKECDAWTVIYQQDTRLPGASPLIDQAIMLVRVETEYGEDDMADPTQRITLISDTKIESNRQTNAPCHLVPGEYLILPYTTGTRVAKGQERGFTVAFFADEPSATKSLAARPYDVEIYTGALCELLRTTGKKSVMGKDSQLWMHELRHGASHIYACAIDPASPRSFSVTLDSAASQNARSHHESAGASSVVQRTVAPGELLLFHHLAPVQESQMTNYNADIKFKAVKPAKE